MIYNLRKYCQVLKAFLPNFVIEQGFINSTSFNDIHDANEQSLITSTQEGITIFVNILHAKKQVRLMIKFGSDKKRFKISILSLSATR